ncbi:MAG: hypothetical protein KDC65_16730 [Saprospiraceae bacterium]|nr:hypothetical protein [Saprospiraceae bacterium]
MSGDDGVALLGLDKQKRLQQVTDTAAVNCYCQLRTRGVSAMKKMPVDRTGKINFTSKDNIRTLFPLFLSGTYGLRYIRELSGLESGKTIEIHTSPKRVGTKSKAHWMTGINHLRNYG